MAKQLTKEIGIRKVLGATVSGITTLLSKDFVKLVFISILIASPITWWAMSKWLQDFAYHIDINWLDVCGGGFHSGADCARHGQLSVREGCAGESGEEPEGGVIL